MEIGKNTAIILMHSKDKPGIVTNVTSFIHQNGGNIVYLDQHVDHDNGVFFMRVEFELKNFVIPHDKIEDYFGTLIGSKYDMKFAVYFSDIKPRMAIFVSKMSHCIYDMLARYSSGEWDVEIPLIISNHPDLEYIAKQFDIPYYYIPINKENKLEQEQKQLELLKQYGVSFVILARYMQILSPQIIDTYKNKVINIHHSFLPAFAGAKPYHASFERGVKIIGATSHYVTEDLDAGPIIEQDVVRVTHKDSIQGLVRKGKDMEKLVLARAVYLHIRRRILVYENKTIIFN